MRTPHYKPIADYGIIGDMHSAALVGNDGSIDWCCLPAFDSPSIFAAVLDRKKGGHFKIAAREDDTVRKQLYFPLSNVLITRFAQEKCVAQVIDFMPVATGGQAHLAVHVPTIVRQVTCVRGEVEMRMECYPAFNYGRTPHRITRATHGAYFDAADGTRMALTVPGEYKVEHGGVVYDFTLKEGESKAFLFYPVRDHESDVDVAPPDQRGVDALLHRTVEYWQNWISRTTYRGRWREMVERSLLTLKLLTYQPTGAIVAAPTCSLPEDLGGVRNWDYRYTWLRDAAFTVYAFMRMGHTDEAQAFMHWLAQRIHEVKPGKGLQPLYTIAGSHDVPEAELDDFEGYAQSRPVRVGNAAFEQLQLDCYGALLDAVYLYNKYGTPISYELWKDVRLLIDWLCDNWQQPDEGVWEVRGGRRQFVFSKLMCWVAFDRAIRLADRRAFPCDRAKWMAERDTIYEQIMIEGWSEHRQTFVQYYGADHLDASLLLMPLVMFTSPTDPRTTATIRAIGEELTKDSLVYRYEPTWKGDGFGTNEGSFSMCTFWLVEGLARSGQLQDARFLFERMLGYANHLGLYAEEVGPSGEALGNFPQAFTHLSLITAAYNLNRALDGAREED